MNRAITELPEIIRPAAPADLEGCKAYADAVFHQIQKRLAGEPVEAELDHPLFLEIETAFPGKRTGLVTSPPDGHRHTLRVTVEVVS